MNDNSDTPKRGRRKPVFLIPGQEAVDALDDPEKMRAIWEQIREAMGIEPEPEQTSRSGD
jgi:hypothetical protein